MKKLLLLGMMLVGGISSWAGTAPAGTDFYTTDGYKATVLEDGTVAITWIYNEGDVTIPAEVTDRAEESTGTYTVSKVGATWVICDNGKIENLVLSEGITSVGQSAFWGVTSMKKLTLPSTLTKIESYAFGDATGLEQIYCAAQTPPALGEDVFKTSATDKEWNHIGQNCKLVVPVGCKELYQSNEPWTYWSTFGNVEESTATDISSAKSDAVNKKHGIYTLSGMKLAVDKSKLGKGIYVIDGKKIVII